VRLRYGAYLFEISAVAISIRQEPLFNARGVQYGRRHVWDMEGQVYGTSQATVQAACVALETALARQGQDLALLRDDGAVFHQLPNGTSTSGVQVVGPSYPTSFGPEAVLWRTFTFTATADYGLDATAPGGIFPLSFEDSLQFSGGGPLFGHLQPVNGRPLKQMIFAATPFQAVQSGRAAIINTNPVGYVPAAPPAFPGALRQAPTIRRHATGQGVGSWQLTTDWTYEFESAEPLFGWPRVI
jgi:hypothetical protein